MSETPRTDAIADDDEKFDLVRSETYWPVLNLARQLERELSEAKKAVTEVCLREQLALEDYKFEKNRVDECNLELARVTEQRDRLAEVLRVFLSRVYYQSVYMDGILRNASFNDRPKAEFDRELAEAREALAAVEGGSNE